MKRINAAILCLILVAGLAEKAAAADDHNPALLDTKGWVYYRAERPADALPVLQGAVDLAPREAILHYHLGKILLALNRTNDAREVLRKALALTLPPTEQRDAENLLAAP